MLPPDGTSLRAILVFVHGDGALDRTAHDYYRPIFERLRRAGYASLSWDKPGVGASTGDWLSQSMADRRDETRAAIDALRLRSGACPAPIGLFGFSQAGWVVPGVAADSDDVDFAIGVGFAIDWARQGRFLTETRLRLAGRDDARIDAALAEHDRRIALYRAGVDRERFVAELGHETGVPRGPRYGFAVRNVDADASANHERLDKPLLVLLGEHDRNVDVRATARALDAPGVGRANLDLRLLAGATHSMLHVDEFDVQSPGLGWWLRFTWLGEAAFVPEFLDTVETWLDRTVPARRACRTRSAPREAARREGGCCP